MFTCPKEFKSLRCYKTNFLVVRRLSRKMRSWCDFLLSGEFCTESVDWWHLVALTSSTLATLNLSANLRFVVRELFFHTHLFGILQIPASNKIGSTNFSFTLSAWIVSSPSEIELVVYYPLLLLCLLLPAQLLYIILNLMMVLSNFFPISNTWRALDRRWFILDCPASDS